jgi:hypothetical protein
MSLQVSGLAWQPDRADYVPRDYILTTFAGKSTQAGGKALIVGVGDRLGVQVEQVGVGVQVITADLCPSIF